MRVAKAFWSAWACVFVAEISSLSVHRPFVKSLPSVWQQECTRSQQATMAFSSSTTGGDSFSEEKKDEFGESIPSLAMLGDLPSFPTTPHKKMLVFDKDGTLGDCIASLRRWANHMTDQLELVLLSSEDKGTTQKVLQEYHAAIGWDAARQTVVPSAPLAAGTWQDQVATTAAFVSEHVSSPSNINDVFSLVQSWHDDLGNLHGQDAPLLENLPELLQKCHELGWLIAVCTSDDRAPTDAALAQWKIDDIVQFSVCGDEVSESKPSATPLQVLCQQASVSPQHCVVVGDTSADTGMARNAKAGFCIGVLTGSGTAEQLLATGAQWIAPDVGQVPELLRQLQQADYTKDRDDDSIPPPAARVAGRVA